MRNIFIVSFVIVLILMIGSASAKDTYDLNETDTGKDTLKITQIDNIEESGSSSDGFNVSLSDEYFKDDVNVAIEMPNDASSNMTVKLDGTFIDNISSEDLDEHTSIYYDTPSVYYDFSKFSDGKHNMTFSYDDGRYSFFKQATINLMTFKAHIPTSVMVNDESDDMGPAIQFSGVSGLNGDITVYIDNKKKSTFKYDEDDIEGYYLGNLKFGNHVIKVTFTNGTYTYSRTENVNVYYDFIVYSHIYYGEKQYLEIGLPDDIGKGKFTVKIDNKKYSHTRHEDNGVYLKISDLNLAMGTHQISISYSGDNDYYPLVHKQTIEVIGKIEVPETHPYCPSSEEISLKLPKDANGNLSVKIEIYKGEEYVEYKTVEISLENGSAVYSVNDLPLGEDFHFTCSYTGSDYKVEEETCTFEIVEVKITKAKDIEMSYNDGTVFKVKVTHLNGCPIDYAHVTILIDGKPVNKIITDNEGYATYRITQTPKKYKITAQIGGAEVTKKLTVKQILSVKKVKVKKSTSKLVLTATLKKVKGKYLKGKKITFKFNGKTYNAKTDKKGVAKVTVKKNVLKKLKVGAKISYQATYIKDTVKKTVKVVK